MNSLESAAIPPDNPKRFQVIAAATEAASELGASHKRMVSRAYHDSLFMSQARPLVAVLQRQQPYQTLVLQPACCIRRLCLLLCVAMPVLTAVVLQVAGAVLAAFPLLSVSAWRCLPVGVGNPTPQKCLAGQCHYLTRNTDPSRDIMSAALCARQAAPTAMIFIPCRNGWSHRPDEYSSPEDIARGVQALALTLAKLAGGAPVQAYAPPAEGQHSEL